MSDHRTRTGARLRTHSLVVARGIAQMTAADYAQPACEWCGQPIHDDRAESGHDTRFCSRLCSNNSGLTRRGLRATVRGRATTWRPLYDAARAAQGQWVTHQCVSRADAMRLAHSIDQRRDFQAMYRDAVVSVRLVSA